MATDIQNCATLKDLQTLQQKTRTAREALTALSSREAAAVVPLSAIAAQPARHAALFPGQSTQNLGTHLL